MTGQFHTTDEKVRFGPFEADLGKRELRKLGLRVKLQGQPFKLLANLLECPGEVVTREDLQRRIWGDEVVVNFDHSLGTAVNKVREALGDSPDNPRYIETLPRCGYRFIAPVQRIEPVAQPEVTVSHPGNGHAALISGIVEVANPAPPLRSKARFAWSPSMLWGVAACVIFGIAGLLRVFWNPAPPAPSVRFSQITWSGRVYAGANNIEKFPGIGTDGVRIYFSQMRDGHPGLASVSVSGGEVQTIPTPAEIAWPVLVDVSRDGSRLLVRSLAGSSLEQALWIVPSQGGTASRVLSGPAHDGIWAPDGVSILYASGRDLLITHNDGRTSQKLATLPGRAFGMRYSPDGSSLRFTLLGSSTHASSLWQLSADGKDLHPLLAGWHNPPAECCGRWTADGKSFVFQSTRDGTSNIWALQEKRGLWGGAPAPIQITSGPLNFLLPLPARQDNRVFVTGAQTRGQVFEFDVPSGKKKLWFPDLAPGRIAFSRDGKFMAWSNANDGTLWRSKVDGSERLQLTSNSIRVFRMAWSPDGSRIVFDGKEPGRQMKIYVVSADGGIPEMLLSEDRNESDPSWSPDGAAIVLGRLPEYLGEDSAHKAIYVVSLKTKTLELVPGSQGLFAPRWSPDGRYIAAMPLSQLKLMIFDRSTSKWTATEAASGVNAPAWTRDSRYVYYQSVREQAMYRVSIPDGRTERVADIDNLQPADTFSFVGLSLNDSPLLRAQFLTSDIYRLAWTQP